MVGVAGTTKYRWLRENPQPVMYVPATTGNYPDSATILVRSALPPETVKAQLAALVKTADPRFPLDSLTTLEAQLDTALSAERLLALLSTTLGLLAVSLAAIGLYGVLSYSTARRTREIGIRLAIGAGRRSILVLILRESAWMIAAGLAAGVPLALASGKLIGSLLYGLPPADPRTTELAVAALLLISLAAALLPALRATRVDPMSSLRYE